MSRILVLCVVVLSMFASAGRAGEPPHFAAARGDSVEIEPGARSATPDAKKEMRPVPDKAILKGQMAALGEVELPGERRWQRRKSSKVAVISNMIIPGLGQVYNGRRMKAATMVGLFSGYVARSWIEDKKKVRRRIQRDQYPEDSTEWRFQDLFVEFHRETAYDYAWWAGAIYLLGMLDAFVDAHLFDVRSVDPAIMQGSGNQHYIGLSARF